MCQGWKNTYLQCLKTPGKTLYFISFIWHLKVKVLFLHLCHRKSAILDFYFLSAMFFLQIAFPVSHIGFTISPNFDNLTVKWNWRLICGWITATLSVCWYHIPLFPIDFNGKPEIFLKHLKKKRNFFKGMCACDWTLIIFQDGFALHYPMSTLFF